MSDQPERFLIFNNGMIGNALYNMPAAAWLKKTYPGCFVGMVVDRVGVQLVKADPNVDLFHIFNKKKDSLGRQAALIMELRRRRYDMSLHLRKGVRNELLARFGGVKLRVGYRLKGSPQHLHVKIDENASVHRLRDRAALLEAALGRPVELAAPRLFPDEDAEKDLDATLDAASTRRGEYLVLHPTGDSQGGMSWSLETYALAVKALSPAMPVFIVCMPDEQTTVEKRIPADDRVHYYTGSIATTSALIRWARVFVGNDSGPAHMAAAWNSPRVAVYLDNEDNYRKWRPIDMEKCAVLFQKSFSPDSVVDNVRALMDK